MDSAPPQYRPTRHATARRQQRGVPARILDLLIANADIALHAGAGCETLRVSRRMAQTLVADGAVPDDVAHAARLAAVVAEDVVVSVLRPEKGTRGRHYRRQGPTRAMSVEGRRRS